jgi:TolB-like protein
LNRWSSRILIAAIVVIVASPPAVRADDDVKEVYPMAVLPFKERGSEVKGLGGKVTDLAFAQLIAKPELFLVDREDMKKILDELELGKSGLVKPDEAARLGQMTGAKLIMTGTVLQVDSTIYLVAKIIGTETSRVVGTSVKGNARDDLGDLVEELAEKATKKILEESDKLVAKPLTRDDRVAALKKKVAKAKLPALRIKIEERHIGRATIDPAAETEVTLYATESGFTVIDPDEGDKKDADVLITGEGMSEYATRHGNLISVRARLEVKAIDVDSGEIIAIDRHTAVAVGLTERIAGKSALQSAAASIAERLLPKVADAKKKTKKKKKDRKKD